MRALRIGDGRVVAVRIAAAAAVIIGGLIGAGATASAAASLTAPSTGQAGKTILISGSGWPGLDSVDAYLDQGSTDTYFCLLSTDATGDLGPQSCSLPTSLPQGAFTLEVSDGTVKASQPFTLKPAAHVSATSSGGVIGSVAAGQAVYLSGDGFGASSTITTVKVGSAAVTTNPAAPSVSAQGVFTGATFTVPASSAPGATTVTVTDSASNSATFSLTVYAATDKAASTGVSGRNLDIKGAGWPSNDTVDAYLDQGATQNYFCSVPTDTGGNLGPQGCALPTSLPEGSYTLSVTDQKVTVDEPFTLEPGAEVSATATGAAIGSVAAGQTVYLAGSGFGASSTITKVTVAGKAVVLTPTAPAVSAQGTFSGASFVVPATAATGSQAVTVTDSSSNVATSHLSIYAATDTSSATGVSGANLAILGAGWPDNDTVDAYLDQGATQNYFCSIRTDANGALGPEGCALPTSLPHGTYTLSVTDQQVTVDKGFTLEAGAHFAATATGGPIGSLAAGQTVYLSGSGFTTGTTIKSVKVGTTSLTISPAASPVSEQGSFTGVAVSIPTGLASGSTTFTVTDASKQSATVVSEVYDATTTAAASGVAGSGLAISGGGWPADDAVDAYLDQGTTQTYFCSIPTDDSGNLGPTACDLPTSLPQGSYTLSLTDQAVTVTKAFTLNPFVELFNTSDQRVTSAAPGATLELSGDGFTASSDITSVKVGTKVVTTTPSPPLANADGQLSEASFAVPTLSAGSYTVTVTDSAGKSATAPLTIT